MNFGYRFNFSSSGQIVSYDELRRNGKSDRERIDRDENAYVENGLVIIEEIDDGALEWDIFRDADNDGVWQKVAEGETAARLEATKQALAGGETTPPPSTPPYSIVSGPEDTLFRFNAAGRVTHVGELERRGKVDWDKVDKSDVFEVRDSFILEKEFERGKADDWTLYHDADRDGRWAEIATGHGTVDFSALLAQMAASGVALA